MHIVADENIPLLDEFFAAFGSIHRLPGRGITAADVRDADLLPAVRDAAQALLQHWPQHVAPLLERWLRHGQQYGQV